MSEIEPLDDLRSIEAEVSQLMEAPIAGNIRPHHFWDLIVCNGSLTSQSPFRMAIMGEINGEVMDRAISIEVHSLIAKREELIGNIWNSADEREYAYINDIIGDWGTEQVESWYRRAVADMARLSFLPNGAVIKLGVAKDKICECAIGNHCVARDLARYNKSRPSAHVDTCTVSQEERVLKNLKQHFSRFGLDEGFDYVIGSETLPLQEEDGTITDIDAQYMLLTMGDIRLLLHTQQEKPRYY